MAVRAFVWLASRVNDRFRVECWELISSSCCLMPVCLCLCGLSTCNNKWHRVKFRLIPQTIDCWDCQVHHGVNQEWGNIDRSVKTHNNQVRVSAQIKYVNMLSIYHIFLYIFDTTTTWKLLSTSTASSFSNLSVKTVALVMSWSHDLWSVDCENSAGHTHKSRLMTQVARRYHLTKWPPRVRRHGNEMHATRFYEITLVNTAHCHVENTAHSQSRVSAVWGQ